MSDETRTGLDNAISAHIADIFPGHYTSGWVVIVSSTTLDKPNSTNYRMLTPETQPLHVDEGLLTVGRKIIQDSWDYNEADGDEDE